MNLAYSSNAFTRTDLASALRSIAGLGYTGAEILCDRPHWFPGEVSEADVRSIAQLLSANGLVVSNLNANTANGYYLPMPPENVFEPSLSSADAVLRSWRQRYTIEAVRLAAQLGAPCVSVTSGHPRPGCSPEQALEFFVDSLRGICVEAQRCNVRIGIEYEPGLLVERATEALAVIERVGSPALGVNFDIGHSWLDGEEPERVVALLAGRIWNVHVEDIRGRKHFHRVPGDGDLPFARYFDALRGIGYSGFLTVELYTYPECPEEVGRLALSHLQELLHG